MVDKFQKKTSQIIVTVLIGLIIISFMFGGYMSSQGTKDTIASVDGIPIKMREYQAEFSRQIQFYTQIFGGSELTSKQIAQFKIRENSLTGLMNQKLLLLFADKMGIFASETEVSNKIINYSHTDKSGKTVFPFQKDNQFSIDLYKKILANNRMNPQDFEKDIGHEIKSLKTRDFLSNFPLSKKYLEDLYNFKTTTLKTLVIQFSNNSLAKFIKVTKKEISAYLKDSKNTARVENIFKERKVTYDKPETVKARHILLQTTGKNEKDVKAEIEKIAKKLTPANFKKMAKKYTEDPSGKNNGGDLGEFSRGKMVPEFDEVAFTQKVGTISKPVKTSFGYHLLYVESKKAAVESTFDQYKTEITTELIRKLKTKEQKKLVQDLRKQLKDLVEKNRVTKIKALQKKYDFSFEEENIINKLEGSKGKIVLEENQIKDMFLKTSEKPQVFIFDDPLNVTIVSAEKVKKKDDVDKDSEIEKERSGLSNALNQKLRQDIITILRSNSTIKTFVSFKEKE